LASSRSADGKDDSALIYVDCIKALSAKQLHLHYIIYSTLQEIILSAGKQVNPGLDREINAQAVWLPLNLLTPMGLRPDIDLNVLHRQGLLSAYVTDVRVNGTKALPYMKAQPTTFGVLLFAAAMNSLPSWNQFGRVQFPPSPDIPLPPVFTASLEELARVTGLETPPPPSSNETAP
jgi:hypothetical protein